MPHHVTVKVKAHAAGLRMPEQMSATETQPSITKAHPHRHGEFLDDVKVRSMLLLDDLAKFSLKLC